MPMAYSRYYSRLAPLQRRLGVPMFIDHLPVSSNAEVRRAFDAGLKFVEQNAWDRAYQTWYEGRKKAQADELAALLFLSAGCLYMKGQMTEAQSELKEAIKILHQTGNKHGLAIALYLAAVASDKSGDNRLERQRLLIQVIALARSTGDDELRAKALIQLGELYQENKLPDRAITCYRQALGLLELMGHTSAASNQYRAIGDIYLHLGELDKARAAYEDSLHMARECRSRLAEAESLRAIGVVHRLQRDYKRAIDMFDRAMRIFQELEHLKGQAKVLYELALAHERNGEMDIAREFFEQGATFARRVRDTKLTIENLLGLAMNFLLQDHSEQARSLIEEAEAAVRAFERAEEKILVNIVRARYHITIGEYEHAIHVLHEALELSAQIQDHRHKTKIYLELTRALSRAGRIAEAERMIRQFWRELRGIYDDEELKADGWFEAGMIKFARGETEAAQQFISQAYALHKQINLSRAMALDLLYLAKLNFQKQLWSEAQALIDDALPIAQNAGNLRIQAELFEVRGDIRRSRGDGLAASDYGQALELYRMTGDDKRQAELLKKLGLFYLETKIWDKAKVNLEQALLIFQRLNDRENAEAIQRLLGQIPAGGIGIKLATGA